MNQRIFFKNLRECYRDSISPLKARLSSSESTGYSVVSHLGCLQGGACRSIYYDQDNTLPGHNKKVVLNVTRPDALNSRTWMPLFLHSSRMQPVLLCSSVMFRFIPSQTFPTKLIVSKSSQDQHGPSHALVSSRRFIPLTPMKQGNTKPAISGTMFGLRG